ncbi:sigma-54 dependent transcriptional regulator [Pseudomonas poae]|uniref:Response regulator n=1 Tax=Pseudomonas poae TaxID=200451 RepID=A0AAP2WJ32_9PSED|nr:MULTISPECIES: sigma-54 dependent transcriptional regulator [Pseudomonas]AGE24589.1 sigma-54 dependent DNA-binding response regulator [Pseudomonas poae RE*1-1-14]MBC3197670.1 sigma-54-dependent Fis family transcriptional regulator [Pseudomonas poae]MCF5655066.1 response regulator [Pseudomonas poae]MCF5776294.1 response regulator [Pseudomonas poae]NMZ51274.1 sigma-54-dependent Fis family transcriptional regulator [Pseudomonas poae]
MNITPQDLTVLIVEDDPHVLLGCQQALALEDIASVGVGSAEEALKRVDEHFAGIVISDIRLPGIDGLELLTRLKALDKSLPVVLITGHGDIAMAVGAMRNGAYDFMEKPFSPERLVDVARRALEQRALAREVWALRRQLAERDSLEGRIIGRSQAMQNLRDLIANVADTSANVLIEGETGTGKELVARCLHDFSRRHSHPFVALNCGGLPENLFESEIFGHEANAFTGAGKRRIGKIEHAHQGTLFLDEVESMPINLQIKLLRVLQERTLERLGSNQSVAVDCRVIAATKSDLDELSRAGQFRSDLYYRLNVVTLELPPLRERREDILQLFEHFLQQSSLRFDRSVPDLDNQTLSSLMSHDWPGNVRELRNVAERFALGLPAFKKPGAGGSNHGLAFTEAVEAFERNLLNDALQRSGGNLTQASQELGMAKTTLFDKVKKYGLGH